MLWIIDRIEGNFAVVKCGEKSFDVPLSFLPDGASEGDCLKVLKDNSSTADKEKKADAVLRDLFGE